MPRLTKQLSLAGLLFIMPFVMSAQTALIDIGQGQGIPTSPDTNGSYWNSIASVNSPLALISTENSATGWSFAINGTANSSHNYTGGLTALSTGAPADFAISGAYQDAWFDNSTSSSTTDFSFTNLNPSTTYEVRVWGSRLQGSGDSWSNGSVVVNIGSAVDGPSFTLLNGSAGNTLSMTITPDASGNFGFDFGEASGVTTGINVMSITAIPEPQTYGLIFGLVGFGWVVFRRLRQRRC